MSSGRCPTRPDEAALTTRSMKLLGLHVGARFSAALVDVQRPDGSAQVAPPHGGGHGRAVRPRRRLLGRSADVPLLPDRAAERPSELPPLTDAVWLGDGAAAALGVQSYSVDVPVDGRAIGLDDGAARRGAGDPSPPTSARSAVSVTSQLPPSSSAPNRRSDVVRVAAPLAAFQLVLLAWVILAHVVGSATQERAPELGLAKLRGLTPPRTVRFGLGEVSVLLLLSAPIGTLLGWWVVREVADGTAGAWDRAAGEPDGRRVGAARRRRWPGRRGGRGPVGGARPRRPTCCAGCRRAAARTTGRRRRGRRAGAGGRGGRAARRHARRRRPARSRRRHPA